MAQAIASAPQPTVHIVGGGLAGSEAAWQCLNLGCRVVLHEMRPLKMTAAHQTGMLAELVCSNSLKSLSAASAPGALKFEMQALGSLILQAAEVAKVPAGQALAVERAVFSQTIASALESHSGFCRINEEVTSIPDHESLDDCNEVWIIASGPLTSAPLAAELQRLSGGNNRLFFYDAIAPIIAAESIDYEKTFRASRYEDDGDYLNLPLDRDTYERFIDAVSAAEKSPLHDFESTAYFEACLPIEVMIERGRDTLRFGPMKPVGLTDPRTGRYPYAAVQLRLENKAGTMYSMVGFQTKMKWPEQQRVFALLPGLEHAEFLRFGSIHRNTYIESPKALAADLSFRLAPRVFLAGQVTGVEGYTESAAIGLLAGRAAAAKLLGSSFAMPPANTIIGALYAYITEGVQGQYQPMNANLGLLPPIAKSKGVGKAERKAQQCTFAKQAMMTYLEQTAMPKAPERLPL